MKIRRIIARLDIKGPNLVKGIHLEGLRVMGTPEVFAKHYYNLGVDELIYSDVVASLYGRNSILNFIEKTANVIAIPLSVGGGIRTIDDIKSILNAGADKVILNTVAIKNPKFVSDAAEIFGSSTIVVAIETTREKNKKYLAYTDNGRVFTGIEAFHWAKELEKRGVGEILVTSIDNEGTGDGFDLELISQMCKKVSVPVIAHGGAGNQFHVKKLFKKTNCDGVAISSLFHYGCLNFLKKKMKIDPYSEGNKEFILSKKKSFKSFKEENIKTLKKYLSKYKIKVRV